MVAYCSTPKVLTLTLGSVTLDLMDQANGFRINELDLGYPDVREDVDLRADAHGTVDLTRLFGARAVTISGAIVPSAYGSRQKTWHQLAPFLNPAARLTLTWQVDGDVTPRTLTVRPAQVSGPYNSPQISQFQLGFKAPDPRMYDAIVQQAITSPSATGGGRIYNLTFNRVYPPGGYAMATVLNNGDITTYPTLLLYGPATGPVINETIGGTGINNPIITFAPSFIIGAGNYVEINCRARTALLNADPGNSVYGQIQPGTIWPYLPPGSTVYFFFSATNTSNVTQCQIFWQDAYLI